ncbi:MAG: hypothetical protein JXN61_04305 [Sedimentisphaerales bacterium]|nr:hypothetical protein [Sedimentisphaerales bacterium]
MKSQDKDKKLDELITAAIGREDLKFDFDKWKGEHAEEIRVYESQRHQPGRLLNLIRGSGVLRYAAVAAIVAGVLIGVPRLTGGLTTIAWADVTERFKSVPFFSAAIYIKDDVTNEPKQIELWMSRGGKARLRTGTQVIFGDQGKVTRAFDIKTRAKVEADEHAGFLLQKLGSAKEFSLDSVMKVVFGGRMEDVTPLINPDAVVSRDMVVFDIQSTISPEWLRIWALRESRLPVRIKVWDPRDGEGTDVVFSYSREQPDEFFDPNAFAGLLRDSRGNSRANLAYAYLKDPGGRRITPEDMFEDSGFHMPQIKHVGITPKGAVWVIAEKASNRTPEGRVFYGFEEIADDLDRVYQEVYSSHRVDGDQSMEVFVPIGYPFDGNIPGKITLSCKMKDYEALGREPLVGTVELTQWKQNEMWPEGTIGSSPQELATTLAWQHANAKRYTGAERIIATIEGEPETDSAALTRERIRLRILVSQEKCAEAVELGQRLMPTLEDDYRRWKGYAPHPDAFTDYLRALAYTKRLDEVKQVWDKIKAIDPHIPDRLNKRARRHIEEDMQAGFKNAARILVPHLSREAHLTVEQINEMLQLDIKNDETFKHYVFWDWNPEFEKPEFKNWQRRLSELAEYYKTHPLPERMEILERDRDLEFAVRFTRMPGIDTHFAEPLRCKFGEYVYFYKYPESAGRLRMEDGLAEMKLQHDIVFKTEIEQPERIAVVLDYFGLEVVEVNEPRQVWVAKHDGRKLKDFKEVKAPGKVTAMSSGGLDLEYLFRSLMDQQNRDAKAAGPVIIDRTGLTQRVSLECPSFEGSEGLETARKWFAEEMGVTFTEEVRRMTTYIIRKRQ